MASAVSWKCQKCSAVRSMPEVDAGANCFRCRLATAIDATGRASVYVKNGMYVVTAQTGDEASRGPLPLEGSVEDPVRVSTRHQPPAAASEVSVAFLTDIIHELRHDITELKKGLSAVEMILVAIDHRLDRMERDDDRSPSDDDRDLVFRA